MNLEITVCKMFTYGNFPKLGVLPDKCLENEEKLCSLNYQNFGGKGR